MEFFDVVKDKWQREIRCAVRCPENSLEARLTFFCLEEKTFYYIDMDSFFVKKKTKYSFGLKFLIPPRLGGR
jgi:hypothetical protein